MIKKNQYPGLFIVFEGLDGSGSSSQAELLTNSLKASGHKVFLTKEPTNHIIGGLIRGQLTDVWKSGMECLQLLFAADRAHHLEREIIPALKDNRIVISDRYFFSTIAFGAIELDKNWLISLNEKIIYPDITILIRVAPEECLKRIEQNRFQLELFEKREKLQRVWRNYLWLKKKFPNVYLIDGERDKQKIASDILKVCQKLILTKKNKKVLV